MLKKIDRIIASIRKWHTRYLRKSHKFGIEIPNTLEYIIVLDDKNSNTFLTDAISKEMKNVRVAFEVLPDEKPVSIGPQFQ